MTTKCAALYCRRRGVVRCLVDSGWPGPPSFTIRYWLCMKHADIEAGR